MSSQSPAILPISNQQSTDTAAGSPPAFRVLINYIGDTVRNGLVSRRSWTELLDRSALSKPESINDATYRIRKNYTYFRVNYLIVITAVLAISLLTNPVSLIILAALLIAWVFLYLFRTASDPPLTIFGRQFSEWETFLGLTVSTVVVIFLTSVGSVLISALMVGVAIVAVHGAFRTPDDLFLDDQDSPATGFLSFLTGTAPNSSSAPPAPPVAARG